MLAICAAFQDQTDSNVPVVIQGNGRIPSEGNFFHSRQRPAAAQQFAHEGRLLRRGSIDVGRWVVGHRQPHVNRHTFCGLNPSGTVNKSQKLRSRRPAAIISANDRANSVTTSTRRVRVCSPEPRRAAPFQLEHREPNPPGPPAMPEPGRKSRRRSRGGQSKKQNAPVDRDVH